MFSAQRNDKWEKYDDDLSFSNDLWCFISVFLCYFLEHPHEYDFKSKSTKEPKKF